jgi:diguanylate cyclase (GGDEF)-like protein
MPLTQLAADARQSVTAGVFAMAPTATMAMDSTLAQPRNLAGGAAIIIVGLFALLYLYRRRSYIVYWAAGWACLAGSLFVAGWTYERPQLNWLVYGASQLLSIGSALCFVVAADAYNSKPRFRRAQLPLLAPLAIWFLLAPMALGIEAVFVPGHLLAAGLLTFAGGAHIVILRETKLLGAGLVGVMLVLTALTDVWAVTASRASAGLVAPEAFLMQLAMYLITALGMQLMTFEDMTGELRHANNRLEAVQAELRQMVVTDALTSLRNRRFFDEIIRHELSTHRRYATPLSLLFIDVDRFKSINDTLGHAAGDRVLRDVAGFLMRNTRDADYVFRWGGDEFLLLLSCREDEAVRRGIELQLEFARSPAVVSLPPGVGLSFGAAEVSPKADTVNDALKIADERMYLNKRGIRMAAARAM